MTRQFAPSFRLDGRRVLVTGGTQGVGGAIARGIAASGADVAIIGLKQDEAAEATIADCRRVGATAELILMDLARPASVWIDQLMRRVDEVMPGIDGLVNNAGTYADPPFLEVTAAGYEKTMNLNVGAGFFLTQAFSRRWVADGVAGRVVFTGSINGFLSEPEHSVYDTSKGAVAAMVRTLCVELAPHDIRVNSMAPGLVRTPLTSPAIDQPDFQAWMKLHTPCNEVPSAEACVGATVFLLSDGGTARSWADIVGRWRHECLATTGPSQIGEITKTTRRGRLIARRSHAGNPRMVPRSS